MGGGKSGSTGTTSQNQTSSVSIPPDVLARYNAVNSQAASVAQAPFNPYSGEFVAPVNATQQGGINQITGAAGWINPTYSNTVNTISAGLGAAQPQYDAASSNIQGGLAGGTAANQTALGQYGAATNAAQPYNAGALAGYGQAAGLAAAGTGAVNPTAVDSNAIGQYMSPYNNAVVQSTMALLGQQQGQQTNALKTQQILGGAFGGNRGNIDQSVLAGQQNLASANVISGLENQNYAQALGAAQQQQGVGLGAAQANRAALQQGASQFQGLGSAVQGLGQQVYGQGTGQAAFTGQIGQQGYQQALGAAGAQTGLGQAQFGTDLAAAQGYGAAGTQALQSQLAQGQAQLGAGTVQQQTQQAQDQAAYQQFLQEQAYPFQTTQFQAGIAEGTGALSGSTTSGTSSNYTPQPFFSDRRLKENIKTIAHTNAGIPIVQYNYKGHPGRTQIGLIAQDVEKKRPDAVGLSQGYKTVDYERALRARGGGLAGGGPAMVIYHIGGSVDPEDAGRGFADGGAPGLDANTMAALLAAHQAMYPGAAGRAGMDGSGPRGLQLAPQGSHQLMKSDLRFEQPKQQQDTGLSQDVKTLGALSGLSKDAGTLYSAGKDAVVGSAAKGTPGAAGYTPATGGLGGTGGQWDPQNGWFGKQAMGLSAANSNTPSTGGVTSQPLPDITPSAAPVDTSGGPLASAADDTSTLVADAGSNDLIDSALDLAWRGGRQGRDTGGPTKIFTDTGLPITQLVGPPSTLQDSADLGVKQATLGTKQGARDFGLPAGLDLMPKDTSMGLGAATPTAAMPLTGSVGAPGTPGTAGPAGPAGPAAEASPIFQSLLGPGGGSANGATGSGGDSTGGVSGTGGVGGSASDGAGGSAAAGTGGDDGGTYRKGGTVHRALELVRRPKRYASGGISDTPYDDVNGYVPDNSDDQDVSKLEKEQKDMEAPLIKSDTSGTKGSSGSGLGKTVGSLAGGVAGSFFGPIGTMAGSAAGGLLGGLFNKGGRAGFQDGGGPDDPPVELAEAPSSSLELPKRDNVVPFVPKGGLNPERPAARETTDKAAVDQARDEAVQAQVEKAAATPGLGAAAPAPAPTSPTPTPAPAAAPGPASPTPVTTPPGFNQPGMQQPEPPKDNWAGMTRQESGNQQFGKDGHPTTSSAGARGIAQVMPTTAPIAAKLAGVPWNPELFNRPMTGDQAKDQEAKDYNLKLGRAYYDDQLKTFGDPNIASAAYNAGPDNVAKALQKQKETGRNYLNFLPKETQDYVRIVSGGGPASLNAGLAGGAAGPSTGGLGGALSSAGDWITNAADKTGDWLDRHEKQIVPALAFLGSMLSSPSRTLAGSVGSGMVGGAKALQGQQELGQGQQRIGIGQQQLAITANAQDMAMLAQYRQLQSQLTALPGGKPDPQYDAMIKLLSNRIAQRSAAIGSVGTPGAGNPAAGVGNEPAGANPPPALAPTAPPAGNASVAPLAPPAATPAPTAPPPGGNTTRILDGEPGKPESWGPMPSVNMSGLPIADYWNPSLQDAAIQAAAASGNPGQLAAAKDHAAEVQNRLNTTGQLPGKDGNPVTIPGFKERQQAEANVAENQKALQTETAAATTRQTARMQLGQIKNLLQTYESGTGADVLAEAQGVANALGINLPAAATSDPQKFQEFIKNAYGIMLSQAGMNQNETDALRGMVNKTFASPQMQPGANRKILAETEAGMDLAQKRFEDLSKDVQGAPHLPQSRWLAKWQQQPENNLETRVKEAAKKIPVLGDVPAKRSELEEGTQYILRPQEAIKLFADPTKPGATAADIKKQFGDKKTMRVVIKNGVPYPVQ